MNGSDKGTHDQTKNGPNERHIEACPDIGPIQSLRESGVQLRPARHIQDTTSKKKKVWLSKPNRIRNTERGSKLNLVMQDADD